MNFLEGKKTYLRPLEKEDIKGNYRKWFNDQEVYFHNTHGVFPVMMVNLKKYFRNTEVDKL